jgi:ferric-dicitrate binding protein FerR (iron transport regulator)
MLQQLDVLSGVLPAAVLQQLLNAVQSLHNIRVTNHGDPSSF